MFQNDTTMIFKLRMLSDESDAFVREYEVAANTDLLQLHDTICQDLGLDRSNFCSFFTANERWNKLQEYTLTDMFDDDESVDAQPMEDVRLDELAAAGTSRLIFVFDLLSGRSLYLSIADFGREAAGESYPRVVLSEGELPEGMEGELDDEEDEDPFGDMMAEFADFEGSEDDNYSDDF